MRSKACQQLELDLTPPPPHPPPHILYFARKKMAVLASGLMQAIPLPTKHILSCLGFTREAYFAVWFAKPVRSNTEESCSLYSLQHIYIFCWENFGLVQFSKKQTKAQIFFYNICTYIFSWSAMIFQFNNITNERYTYPSSNILLVTSWYTLPTVYSLNNYHSLDSVISI
jgi:hypothetical protein